jgi:hypothetical protein
MKFLLFLVSTTLFAQYSTPTRPACGKYTTAQWPDGTYSCERYAAFPWFAAGQGWSTQVPMLAAPVSHALGQAPSQVTAQPTGVLFRVVLGARSSVSTIYGGISGSYGNFALVQPALAAAASARLDILSAVDCSSGTCFLTDDLAYGPLWVQLDAASVSTLEAAALQLIFILSDSTGASTRQVAVPPVFNDLASANWITSFSETAVDDKPGNVNSNDSSFAVTNLSDQAQSVTVSLYDQQGNLLAQQSTPVLAAGVRNASQVTPGGVFGIDFGSFFGLTSTMLTPSAAVEAAATGTIDGTIRFAASGGQPIAPLVLRIAGSSITSMLVSPLP